MTVSPSRAPTIVVATVVFIVNVIVVIIVSPRTTTAASDCHQKSKERQQASSTPPFTILPRAACFFGLARLSMVFPMITHESKTFCQT
jgi:hypothetical protein